MKGDKSTCVTYSALSWELIKEGRKAMTVKGNHPLAEIIAKKLSGITNVPPHVAIYMVNSAVKAAVEYHEAEIERKDKLVDEAANLLYECVDSESCIYKATLLLEKAMITKEDSDEGVV